MNYTRWMKKKKNGLFTLFMSSKNIEVKESIGMKLCLCCRTALLLSVITIMNIYNSRKKPSNTRFNADIAADPLEIKK